MKRSPRVASYRREPPTRATFLYMNRPSGDVNQINKKSSTILNKRFKRLFNDFIVQYVPHSFSISVKSIRHLNFVRMYDVRGAVRGCSQFPRHKPIRNVDTEIASL